MTLAIKNLRLTMLGFVLSLIMVACGQPARVGWLGALAAVMGFTLFFCMIPPQLRKIQRFALGVLWFTVIQLIQLSWMISLEFQGYYVLFTYTALSLGLACQFGLLTLLIPSEGEITFPKILCCSALWTMMEWSRLFLLCGFSWNPIGLSLTHYTFSMQLASLFGIFGLSFWVMLTNLAGINVWRARFSLSRVATWAVLAAFPYLFGILTLAYHTVLHQKEQNKLNIALIQTDLLPSQKVPYHDKMHHFIPPMEQWKNIILSLTSKKTAQWDLIVFPEAAVPILADMPFYQYETVRELFISQFGPDVIESFPPLAPPYADEKSYHDQKIVCVSNLFICQTLANVYQAELIAGLDHADPHAGHNFNSAFYLKPFSMLHERYDKQILLPIAEYLPFDFLRPFAKYYGIHDFFTPGNGTKVLGHKIPFSMAICYEETFPEVMRAGRMKGAQLFIDLTNDNYYPKTSLHEQHFYHARLRAVENGIPLVRSCNSGVTAAINSFGEVIGRLGVSEKEIGAAAGALDCLLTTYHYSTLFSFWGEAGIVSISLLAVFFYLRFRGHKNFSSTKF